MSKLKVGFHMDHWSSGNMIIVFHDSYGFEPALNFLPEVIQNLHYR